MKKLKSITWEDEWANYIEFGQFRLPVRYDRFGNVLKPELCSDPYIYGIISLMYELQKLDFSVYEAYLKAVEIKAASYTENCNGGVLKELICCKKREIKNIKKGIFNEELHDYIEALYRGYQEWNKNPYQPYK